MQMFEVQPSPLSWQSQNYLPSCWGRCDGLLSLLLHVFSQVKQYSQCNLKKKKVDEYQR